ncbi:unnamed protein product [Mycena citricolor]|uniref:Uncharacterized protein n=1 Tax=Mycena citricolor TaxID=2018698 RepID=A0AAD2HT62_9AGAR|nr:unnamed protein product [Mycena citricolor]
MRAGGDGGGVCRRMSSSSELELAIKVQSTHPGFQRNLGASASASRPSPFASKIWGFVGPLTCSNTDASSRCVSAVANTSKSASGTIPNLQANPLALQQPRAVFGVWNTAAVAKQQSTTILLSYMHFRARRLTVDRCCDLGTVQKAQESRYQEESGLWRGPGCNERIEAYLHTQKQSAPR